MSADGIVFLVYAGGLVLGIFVTGAAGVRWAPTEDAFSPFGPGWLTLAWPLAAPYALGRVVAKARQRRIEAAKERQKWLEAPIP